MSRAAAASAHEDENAVRGAAFDLRLMARLWTFIRPHQRLIWLGLSLLSLSVACGLALPWFIKRAIDEHLIPKELDGFRLLLGAFLVVAVLEFFTRRLQMYVIDLAGQNCLFDLRQRIFKHLQELPARFYDRTPIGKLVGRVTTDVESLQEMFSAGVVTILGDIVKLLAIGSILLYYNWKLFLISMVIVPVLLGVTFFIRIRVRAAYVTVRARFSRLNAYLHEQLSGMPVVQMFSRERRSMAGFQDINDELCAAQLKSVRWESSLSAIMEMLGSFAVALILGYGGREAIGGFGGPAGEALTIGMLFLFIDYMKKFFQPLNDLSLKYTVMQNAMTASDRIFALLDEGGIPEAPEDPVPGGMTEGAIEFRGVHFAYNEGTTVLEDINFRLEPGERVAVVGATGSGKTTLLKLLTRLYEIQEGSILLDGIDVRRFELRDLRQRVGIVTQDVFLFEGDIVSNIRLGHASIRDEDAIAAADRLHLDEVVARFPQGYREPVQERGKNLSSGEKQLIAFARVLAREPRVLALDEATSNVDSGTEHLLQGAVHEVMEGRSALIIAHRLSTIRDVDRILVMHRGRLVEQGTHTELLALGGHYHRLYSLQYEEQEA